MLARCTIAALAEDPSLSFDFPSPSQLKPPLITLDMAAVGYVGTPVLRRLNLRIDPDDRIALLGRNGNGKTTLARLLAAQLPPMEGAVTASGKMRVGYFTQYQVEELHGDDTPLQHMTRAMRGTALGGTRAARPLRFPVTRRRHLSASSQAASSPPGMALITRCAAFAHPRRADEPPRRGFREALVQALNGYDGAVIIVSHDRHMIELTADRLVLVRNGEAAEYAGSVDDYIDLVLGGSAASEKPKQQRQDRKVAAKAREDARALKKAAAEAEAASAVWRRNALQSIVRYSIRRTPSGSSRTCR
jgi:ATP-binding cassette subfamily F protein 3